MRGHGRTVRFPEESWDCLIGARAVPVAGEVWTERTLGAKGPALLQSMVQNWDRSSPDVRFVQGSICWLLQSDWRKPVTKGHSTLCPDLLALRVSVRLMRTRASYTYACMWYKPWYNLYACIGLAHACPAW